MKVLHVVATGSRRGAEIFAADLVGALSEEGVEQRVAILRNGEEPAVGFDAPAHPMSTRMSVPGLRVSIAGVTGIRRLVREWHPDLIQTHGGEATKHAVLAGVSAPVVYRRIGEAPRWLSSGPRRAAYGILMRRAARVVTVSENTREEAIRLFGLRPERVRTIPNAIDVRRVEPGQEGRRIRREIGIEPHASVLLTVGALTWEKDPLTHVETFRRVAGEVPDAVHLIVGDGPMRAEVEGAVTRSGVGDRVQMLGSRSDVPTVMAASDVLLLASRPDGMEGMPAVVIEASVAGLPTAGYAVAGVPEVVVDGRTGLLTAPGDVAGLAERAGRLLSDPHLRRSMGQAAMARCRERFDIGVVAPRYLSLYREVVAS
jgi:glycosyltransferase involved in cell wall biosynthesis